MNLKHYYQDIRNVEEKIADPYPVVVSLTTADGGKEGARTEVPRRLAAKMIVEGAVRLAKAEEAEEYRQQQAEARLAVEQALAASRVQFAILSPTELSKLKGTGKQGKDKEQAG
jgi:hypothetical protein